MAESDLKQLKALRERAAELRRIACEKQRLIQKAKPQK
jgi:hypothetical protein